LNPNPNPNNPQNRAPSQVRMQVRQPQNIRSAPNTQDRQTMPGAGAQNVQNTQVLPNTQAMQNTQTLQNTQTFGAGIPAVGSQRPQNMQSPQYSRPVSQQRPHTQRTAKAVKKKNAKRRKAITLAVILGIVGLLVLGIGVTAAIALNHTPGVNDDVPFVTGNAGGDQSSGNKPYFGDAPEASVGAYKRREGVYNFLIAGLDAEGGNHTDVLLVVSYDTANGSAAVLSIPRDTYINVGRNFSKLNSFYTGEYNVAIKKGLRGSEARSAAMEGLCGLLEENLNIKLDYWAMMNLEGFRGIVDAFGGVEIEIAEDMKYVDPYQDLYIDLKAGKQTLNGEQAEMFVRFRDGYKQADKGRINAQKIFITAFINTVKNNISIGVLDDLLREASAHVLTSMSLVDCVYFAKTALSTLDLENIKMMTLPSSGVTNSYTGAWYEVLHREEALSMINEYFNVYQREITEDIFDIGRVFTNTEQDYIHRVYTSSSETEVVIESAQQIDDTSTDKQREAFLDGYNS